MAGVAGCRCRDMGGRLARRPRAGASVTGRAGARSATKDAGGVTCLAINLFVRTVEQIPGGRMIETQVSPAIGLRLRERTPPLTEKYRDSSKDQEEKTSKVCHRRGTSLNREINVRCPA